MADVLSQNEIDALLKQLSTGELDADDFTETKSVKSQGSTIFQDQPSFQKSICVH